MSQQDQQTNTAITSLADLEQLKQQAEAQQRRRAPPLSGQQPQKKKPKLDGSEEQGDDEEEQEGAVGRFAYAAADAIAEGSTCLMASCGFNRQRSAAKELLSIVKPLLPEGTQLQMVKVGCRGLAVVRLEPPVPVIPLVGQVLDQIQSGQLKHTRFCERIVPAEMTCLLTSVALEAALTQAAQAYLAGRQGQQQQHQGAADGAAEPAADAVPAQQQPVEFAVMYKSRGVDTQILADMEKEALQQQQQEQEEKQQQEQDKQQQDKQQEQQQAAGDGAGPAAEEVQGLNRQRIIDLAVAVMQECCKEYGGAKVNLRKPQVVVMVEVVPLLRQHTACAVAMLPASIMSDAAKLKIKPTSLESEQHGQKQKQQGSGGGSKKK